MRDGGLTATIEQFPGQQSALGVQTLVAFLKDGTKPAEKVLLLTPVAVTKDNLEHRRAPRRSEVSTDKRGLRPGRASRPDGISPWQQLIQTPIALCA